MARGRKQGKTSWVVRFVVRPLLIVFAFTILWVLLYRFVPVPFTVPMAKDFIAGKDVKRDWTSLSNIDSDLPRAVIAGEDAKFCTHFGFDTEAISKAMEANAEGRKLRGGSTVSQQVAKNAFLWPGRSWLRKGLEAYFTVLIELMWNKKRIMEVYLNVAEFGIGVYGAEAAARHYYDKSAKSLTRSEAARLVAVLPSPVKRDARSPRGYTARYAKRIERWIRIVDNDGQDSCLGI
ncbi:monofunctional biosynthetic peptidoglycan transglycosylase [Sphingosinicella microcystinivorans]|uniref:monofunctional biosynthetic peptidoglycan transglycosylase n=1 Tax=Sphingosinicella microcystinivorans TaxID=335406 RepID=UPI0022F40144|nr:monofunctional biosynthetic peptidoglycan transglycosylase [Sphingosinicella microcystinivorans]WBX84334.1 monofunctional biosynthetic peptidoglycan transglycosylase [Sphingosinicella microcystinivorans]